MRVESLKACKGGGWLHFISAEIDRKPPPPKPKPVVVKDFTELANQYQDNMMFTQAVAEQFGVSARSLERLGLGCERLNLTWPMRNHEQRIIGISVRGKKGKWCVPGSQLGLFWPEGVEIESDGPVFLPEGATDTAALLTLDFQAIGRPSNVGGVEYLTLAFAKKRRDIVVVADLDEPKTRPDGSVWFPGAEGAESCIKALAPLSRSIKILTPPVEKDVRAWINSGATRETILAVLKNTSYAA